MPKVLVQAPCNQVFAAMCDLTRHAKWAAHKIDIQAGQEGPPAVGHTYTSAHAKAKGPDRVTLTEISPVERFGFHVVMPNGWEFDFTMASTPQGSGTLVTREARVAKMPASMFPLRMLFPLVAGVYDRKFLNNMKRDLETPAY